MASMTVRTTVAFDPATAARLERLARRWGVSKSEALRRSLAATEASESPVPGELPDFKAMTPLRILDWLAANPQPSVPGGWGDDPHQELREMRKRDAEIEGERQRARCKVAEPSSPYPA